jgi:hypothetical protein
VLSLFSKNLIQVDAPSVVYHTNVVMSVGTGWAVVCLDAISSKEQRTLVVSSLQRTGHDIVEISLQQMLHFCGNILELRTASVPSKLFIAMSTAAYDAFSETQRERLLSHVQALVHSPLHTIERVGGGGARCMLAELFPARSDDV